MNKELRVDIQALRGFSILVVLFYHAQIEFFRGGYLGVDIFFVISGFLITGLILRSVKDETFSFIGFYARRAKRLLPAAYVTFLLTISVSAFLLASIELDELFSQLYGAITYTANIVLLRQGSYFGAASDLKPLLHTWSLSIEEQYYLLIPLILFFTKDNFRFKVVCACVAISFVFCLVVQYFRPSYAFYLLPARAWEMGIGSIGAFIFKNQAVKRFSEIAFYPSVFCVLALVINPLSTSHPGIDSAAVTVFTLFFILSQRANNIHGMFAQLLGWFGNISYSLYLIHWPVFSLMRNLWVGDFDIPYTWKIVAVGLSIGLAFLQYRYVEVPFRRREIKNAGRYLVAVGIFTIGILLLSFFIKTVSQDSDKDYAYNRRGNFGFSSNCAYNNRFFEIDDCKTGANPDLIVWGDSNAMHLLPGLFEVRDGHIIQQATKYVCGPILDLAPIGKIIGNEQNRRWAESCLKFNSSVFNYIISNDNIKVVALSSYLSQYLTPSKFTLASDGQDFSSISDREQYQLVRTRLGATIDKLRAAGKKVVIVAPPLAPDFDGGRCVERRLRGFFSFGPEFECSPTIDSIFSKRSRVVEFLDDVAINFDVAIIKMDDALIKEGRLVMEGNSENIYISNAHLSYAGSRYVATRLNLVSLIFKDAR